MTGVAALAVAAGSTLAVAPAASAAGTGAACPSSRVCFYFNSDLQGARADYAQADGNMGNELFSDGPVGANGYNVQVNNNAASVRNNTGRDVIVYPNGGCGGTGRIIYAGDRGNFVDALKNNVSSFRFANSSDCANRDQTNA